MKLPRRRVLRYLQPLREGGSLPAVVETGDGLYVVVGLIAREIGLPVPDLALVYIPEGIAGDERDPEIRELVDASVGRTTSASATWTADRPGSSTSRASARAAGWCRP